LRKPRPLAAVADNVNVELALPVTPPRPVALLPPLPPHVCCCKYKVPLVEAESALFNAECAPARAAFSAAAAAIWRYRLTRRRQTATIPT
jgi:hypothetical protein